MTPFEFLRPRDVDEALILLQRPGAKPLAGGTTLVDLMKLGVEAPAAVVDLSGLALGDMWVENGSLLIGALVSNTAAASHANVLYHAPAVSQALLSGASGQIRNAATMGGNLMQRTRCSYFRSVGWSCNKRDPGSGCPAWKGVNGGHAVLGISPSCLAVNPSDLAVALLALNAAVHLKGGNSTRRVAIGDFYRLPGDTPHIETVAADGELVIGVEIPLSALGRSSSYLKLRGRASYEFASASVAAAIRLDAGLVAEASIAIGGLGTVPWRDRAAERDLLGRPLTRELIARFCDALLSPAMPTPSNAYKLTLARGAIQRSLERYAPC